MMDEREAELRKQEVDALNRRVELEKRYNDALPPLARVGAGEEMRSFLLSKRYVDEMGALEAELESAWQRWQQAWESLRASQAQQRW